MSAKFYVMKQISGDEVLLSALTTWQAAEGRLRQEAAADPTADLSIWQAGGGILAMWNQRTQRLTLTREGCAVLPAAIPMVQS